MVLEAEYLEQINLISRSPSVFSCFAKCSSSFLSELDEAAALEGYSKWSSLWKNLRSFGRALLYCPCSYIRQLSLEQLPLAADCYQPGAQASIRWMDEWVDSSLH